MFVFGCSRSGPHRISAIPPDDVVTLEPLNVLSLPVAEPSGLFYSLSHSLYMISDASKYIYEIDTVGNILKQIPCDSFNMEGITLSANNDTIFVIEENNYKVKKYLSDGTFIESFTVNTSEDPKHALEGITIDGRNNIYLLNEKNPCLLLKLSPNGEELWRKEINYTTDISDICYDKKNDCLWIVSDESQELLKLSMNGDLLQEWRLPIKKAEGLAISSTHIFIVSDSEAKLYIFNKP